ncbi:MRG-domain-containing protein [Cristinia sonorae]|uniref:Chromatin modification-related protein EAF3 n=1 Tax=Cristinia sonorae TaxID=1940300 RepID=A0A8K0UWX9_9AGAR|nr:MRG-domain-containing protein [Cristinia sonorae]
MASSSSAPATFSANERVLCYHGPLMYEAKVLRTETWDESNTKLGTTGPHYFVHYKGWKQTCVPLSRQPVRNTYKFWLTTLVVGIRWDEWVHPARLLKLNDTNLALQKTLQQANAAATASAAGASSSSKAGTKASAAKDGGRSSGRKDGGTRGTKRGREEDDSSKKPEMKLNVPETLKVLLVDDWEAVTKNSQLIALPRTPNVLQLLEEYKAYVLANASSLQLREPSTLLPTIVAGLQTYFDRALGANLLYRFERPQYAEIRRQYVTGPSVVVGQEKEMSSIYGAEHLLRMLVSLPQMVASSTMDPESVGLVRDYVNELLEYMVKERERIFVRQYESASAAYQNISRS